MSQCSWSTSQLPTDSGFRLALHAGLTLQEMAQGCREKSIGSKRVDEGGRMQVHHIDNIRL